MNVRKIAWQVENLLTKLNFCYEKQVASTGTFYFNVVVNCRDSFSIRVSNHGAVYGNPLFSIDATDDGDSYRTMKTYLVELTKKEEEWNNEH
jgi:hypothetical protein